LHQRSERLFLDLQQLNGTVPVAQGREQQIESFDKSEIQYPKSIVWPVQQLIPKENAIDDQVA
jgi:hypothetical protein